MFEPANLGSHVKHSNRYTIEAMSTNLLLYFAQNKYVSHTNNLRPPKVQQHIFNCGK
jgi:hypothetical protein